MDRPGFPTLSEAPLCHEVVCSDSVFEPGASANQNLRRCCFRFRYLHIYAKATISTAQHAALQRECTVDLPAHQNLLCTLFRFRYLQFDVGVKKPMGPGGVEPPIFAFPSLPEEGVAELAEQPPFWLKPFSRKRLPCKGDVC